MDGKDHRIPIVVGVTGHRDLREEDLPRLKDAVRSILNGLRNSYPASPLMILSSLAEGADQLAAQLAKEEFSARLVVPLPLPLAAYKKDFNDPGSIEVFDKMLGQSTCVEMPLLKGSSKTAFVSGRGEYYAQAGAFMVRNSQLLIALWDGNDTDETGGTAQVIGFALNGISEPYNPAPGPLDMPETCLVKHVVTPRMKNPEPKGDPFSIVTLPSSDSPARRRFDLFTKRLDEFNADMQNCMTDDVFLQEFTANRKNLMLDAEADRLDDSARAILDTYAAADTLALNYSESSAWTFKTLFILALVAVLGFEFYAHLVKTPQMLALYPVALLLAFFIYHHTGQGHIQDKFLDFRALAEGLRVKLFWYLAGLDDEVSDHYLRQQKSELDWIRNVIRTCSLVALPLCGTVNQKTNRYKESPDFDLVNEHWVKDQSAFFENANRRDVKKRARHERMTKIFFRFGLLVAVFVVFMEHAILKVHQGEFLHRLLIVVMGFSPAIAAVLAGYAEKMAYSAQARRYAWMQVLYENAKSNFQKLLRTFPQDLNGIRSLIRELGKEALEENGDWVLLHRERPIEIFIH